MNRKLDINSPELEKYRDRIEATIKPYIEITLENNDKPDWYQSKFGGLPYLPKNFEYPKTPTGEYLFLLAQINFSEVPSLENFPHQGILQIYIANDDLYGLDFEHPNLQSGFRILYFPDILNRENIITDFDFLPPPYQYDSPISGCYSLQFTKKYASISPSDYEFTKFLGEEFYHLLINDEKLYNQYIEISSPFGHKIGGYPGFTQDDPRKIEENIQEPYILLLRIDTADNDGVNIMWGDCGIGNFFIKESALKRLDFTDVMYNWDCC
jgi:uncharacterized protein YwqG